MSAGGEDDFGAVDPTPRAPYKPSQRRHQSDDEGDAVNRHDWYCLPAPEPVPQPLIDLSIHPSGLQPVLQNVVSTFSMGCCVNLKEIVQKARNAEYNPRRFSAVILRLREPKTTALIFSSGKGVCTGAKDETESKLAARKFARMVQKFGYEATFKNFRIQNLVASVDVGFKIFLEQMKAAERHFNIYYEPEIFPGLILNVLRPKVTILIFVSGKVVITGAKVKEDINEVFEKVYPLLVIHKKKSPQLGTLTCYNPVASFSQDFQIFSCLLNSAAYSFLVNDCEGPIIE